MEGGEGFISQLMIAVLLCNLRRSVCLSERGAVLYLTGSMVFKVLPSLQTSKA